MAGASSNLKEIAKIIRDIAATNFTEKGEEKTLGDLCLDRIAARFFDRATDEQRGATEDWPDNAESYKKVGLSRLGKRRGKNKARPTDKAGKRIGVLTGEMLSDVQLAGTRNVAPGEAVMLYGTSQEVRDKASWFSRGSNGPGDGPESGASNQPPRPGMYELDDECRDAVMDEVDQFLARKLQRLSGGP